jgi:thymidylate kinase
MELIVIEGCDGTGTSTHTDALAHTLRELGYNAIGFHHAPPPKGCSPWTRVTHYASERSKLVDLYGSTDTVIVTDRWHFSTSTFAQTVDDPDLRMRLTVLVTAERYTLPPPLLVFLLDAADGELDARLTRRGEMVRPSDSVARTAYRTLIQPTATATMDTGQPKDFIRGRILELSLSHLRKAPA